MARIRIVVLDADIEAYAEMNGSATARKLLEALPCGAEASCWGDEIYFAVPVEMGEEDALASVASGTIAYWPPGRAFCVFFGQTPYSPVNVIGKIDGDEGVFRQVESGQEVRIESA